jgi:hypothetical protein
MFVPSLSWQNVRYKWLKKTHLNRILVCLWTDDSGGQYGVAESPDEIGDDGNMADTWYSSDGQYWTEVANTPWPIRHACAVHVHRGELFLAAGNAMCVLHQLTTTALLSPAH